jgi:hypothetical protein
MRRRREEGRGLGGGSTDGEEGRERDLGKEGQGGWGGRTGGIQK